MLLLPLFLLPVSVTGAHAGDHHVCYQVSQDPAIGYAVAIQHVYQFPAAWVFQPTSPGGYALPIQNVYQFPAAFVFQPGAEQPFGGVMHSAYDQYAGPSFIPR
jgi:hypothetical protein